MESSACTLCNLVPVLCDDVYQRLSDRAEPCDEEVDVLAASSVEEFVMDGADGCVRIC